VRPEFARFALLRPAFDELGMRFAVDGVFARLLFAGAGFDCLVFDCLVFDCFVDPERAGLDRFTLLLDRDAPPLRPPPRRC